MSAYAGLRSVQGDRPYPQTETHPPARVLFLTQVLPYPLDSGAKVRAYYMLRHLARSYEVTLVSFVRPDDGPASVAHLRTICRQVFTVPMRRSLARNLAAGVRGLLRGLPIVIVRDEIEEMVTLLAGLLQTGHYDLVHADQTSMAWYGLWAADHAPAPRPATVLDQHNAVHLLARRMAAEARDPLRRLIAAREARAFVRYERDLCRRYDAVLTVTPEDRDHHLALFAPAERAGLAAKFAPIPIAVDPAAVQPVTPAPLPAAPAGIVASSANVPAQPAAAAPAAPTILHLGTMFWPPNIEGVRWFAAEVLPLVWQRIPQARFVIAGKNPPAEIRALAVDPRIEVTGYVADPTPYLAAAGAFVVPLHAGGGMRVKILDGWLWGLPIISTPLGAEGIEVRDRDNILLAADAPAFAEAVVDVLQDPLLNQCLRVSGRAWVEEMYAWQAVYARVDVVYRRLLGAREWERGGGGDKERGR